MVYIIAEAGSLITKSIENNKLYYGNSFSYKLQDN